MADIKLTTEIDDAGIVRGLAGIDQQVRQRLQRTTRIYADRLAEQERLVQRSALRQRQSLATLNKGVDLAAKGFAAFGVGIGLGIRALQSVADRNDQAAASFNRIRSASERFSQSLGRDYALLGAQAGSFIDQVTEAREVATDFLGDVLSGFRFGKSAGIRRLQERDEALTVLGGRQQEATLQSQLQIARLRGDRRGALEIEQRIATRDLNKEIAASGLGTQDASAAREQRQAVIDETFAARRAELRARQVEEQERRDEQFRQTVLSETQLVRNLRLDQSAVSVDRLLLRGDRAGAERLRIRDEAANQINALPADLTEFGRGEAVAQIRANEQARLALVEERISLERDATRADLRRTQSLERSELLRLDGKRRQAEVLEEQVRLEERIAEINRLDISDAEKSAAIAEARGLSRTRLALSSRDRGGGRSEVLQGGVSLTTRAQVFGGQSADPAAIAQAGVGLLGQVVKSAAQQIQLLRKIAESGGARFS